jgi:hypothetical protein
MALSTEQKTVLQGVMLQRAKLLVDTSQAVYDDVEALVPATSPDVDFGTQVTAYNAIRIKGLSDIADIIRELP